MERNLPFFAYFTRKDTTFSLPCQGKTIVDTSDVFRYNQTVSKGGITITLVVCVDDRMGMQFNGRRQSQDRLLRRRLLDLVPTRLVMSVRSGAMFSGEDDVIAREDYLSFAEADDWIFAEDLDYLSRREEFDRLILFRWNRAYPSDVKFVFPGEWKLTHREDFPGSSHKNITMEVYQP